MAFPLVPWVRTPADQRMSRLLYRSILASDDDDARQGKRSGQLAAGIESSDLGRRLVIKVSAWLPLVRRISPVSAIDVGRDLIVHRSSFTAIRGPLGRPARPGRSC